MKKFDYHLLLTSDVSGQLSITKPRCRLLVGEVPPIRRVISPEDGGEVIIIAHIYH